MDIRKNLDFFASGWYNNAVFGGVLKWSKRRDSKSRRPVTGCKGSNPFSSAIKRTSFVWMRSFLNLRGR